MVASGQHRWAGCGWGLGESESLNSRKQQTRKGPARTAALRLLSQGLSHPQVLRLPQILSQACHGFPLQYLLPTPKRAQLSPSGHPVTSTHTAQGSGQRARNSIGATSSHWKAGESRYTRILVTVSGEQAQGQSLLLFRKGSWWPTPHWAQPLPGWCHGDGLYRKQPGCFQLASQL